MHSRFVVLLLVLSVLLGAGVQSSEYGCGGDANAVPGCSNWCGQSCDDYTLTNKPCPILCLVNGCQCRESYVYNQLTGICVLPIDCPTRVAGTTFDTIAD